jgi:hypothetical protein
LIKPTDRNIRDVLSAQVGDDADFSSKNLNDQEQRSGQGANDASLPSGHGAAATKRNSNATAAISVETVDLTDDNDDAYAVRKVETSTPVYGTTLSYDIDDSAANDDGLGALIQHSPTPSNGRRDSVLSHDNDDTPVKGVESVYNEALLEIEEQELEREKKRLALKRKRVMYEQQGASL